MKALQQILVLLLVLAAGLYVWIAYVPAAQPLLARLGLLDLLGIDFQAAEADAPSGGPRGAGGPVQVVTVLAGTQSLADRVTAIGDGRALRSVTVRSNAVGVITELTLPAGSTVKAGTVIARLQDEAEQIALEQAQIRLEDARTEQERITRLEKTGTVTEVRLREADVTLRSAELGVRQAEFDFSQRKIVAPISGWVGIVDVEVGDRVNAQDVLATITDRSDIVIEFRVPERVVGKMKVGQPITAMPLGLRDLQISGEISAIDSIVDRASRTMLVQGRVANTDDLLRAGMAFSVTMTFAGETLLSIAPLAVQWSSDGPYVWAVRDGKAMQVAVEIAQRNSDSVLVRSEHLQANEQVVTEGVQTLREGAEVAPVNADGAATDLSGPSRKATL